MTSIERLRRRRERMARYPHAWQHLLGFLLSAVITGAAVGQIVYPDPCQSHQCK